MKRHATPHASTTALTLTMLAMLAVTPLVAPATAPVYARADSSDVQSVRMSKAAATDGTVRIKNVSGSVRVTGWSKSEIQVTGTLGSGTERLDFDVTGDRAEIEVVLPRHARNVDGSDLEIRLPLRSKVQIETVSAEIIAGDVQGELDARSVSGDIAISGRPAEITAQTVSGEITVAAQSDKARVESVSGDLRLEGLRGTLTVSTISGEVSFNGGQCERLRFSSVSGDLSFTGEIAKKASLSLESHSGDITLIIPAKTSATFTLETFSGDIENAFGQKAKRTSKYAPGRALSFTTGDGDAEVEVTTFSGDVMIRTRQP